MSDQNYEHQSTLDESTLFTRIAEEEFKNQNHEKALQILFDGLDKFPNYPAAHILIGKIRLEQNQNTEAEDAIKKGLELLSFQPTSNHYLTMIPKIEINVVSEQVEELEVEENIEQNEDLAELADKLSTAKMDVPYLSEEKVESDKERTKPSQSYSNRSLVSETLARIYISQENYKEAKEIYETLIEIQPERKDYYKRKLAEINSKTGAVS